MRHKIGRFFTVVAAVIFLSITVMELSADARGGGSRSMGSRGSRSYTKPAAPGPQSGPQRQQQAAPAPNQMQQQPAAGGGFLRSMAGGLMGGMIGSMLFSSFAGASGGMAKGGGIGMFEIILLAGIGYLIYRFIQKKRAENQQTSSFQTNAAQHNSGSIASQPELEPPASDLVSPGLAHIRQMDSSFDETRLPDTVMDIFFKIQAAWMHRDLVPVNSLLTNEMRTILQGDIDDLLRDKQINRLENIAVRKVELTEAWQETGQDFISMLIQAHMLDYTMDESATVISGSTTEPVKFEEYWTFTRGVGNNPWQLSAITQ